MLDVLESLSLPVVAAILAVVSAALAVAFARIRSRTVAWFAALLTPLLLSYALYWSPVWFGADPTEYETWSFVFIVPWFLAGAIASCLSLVVARRRRLRPHG